MKFDEVITILMVFAVGAFVCMLWALATQSTLRLVVIWGAVSLFCTLWGGIMAIAAAIHQIGK